MAGFSKSLQSRYRQKQVKSTTDQKGRGKKLKRVRKPQQIEVKVSKKLKKIRKSKKR